MMTNKELRKLPAGGLTLKYLRQLAEQQGIKALIELARYCFAQWKRAEGCAKIIGQNSLEDLKCIAEQNKEIDGLRASVVALEAKMDKLRAQPDDFQWLWTDFRRVEAENEALKMTHKQQIKALKADLSTVTKEAPAAVRKLKGQVNRLRRELADTEHGWGLCWQEVERLTAKNQRLQRELAARPVPVAGYSGYHIN